jgi:branched-chain amino acid transport system ATP-binding protein
VPAVRGIDLTVAEGEAVALLGRNGAGKTTTLRALAGVLPPDRGTISFDGDDIALVPTEQRVRRGIALVPEGRGIFPQLTVRENLTMGAYGRRLRAGSVGSEIDRVTEHFPRLRERLKQTAGSLSGGEQQMLAVARGLMAAPRLLMLDEPSLGLAPVIIEQLYDQLANLRSEGLTILVVEQYVEVALGFVDRAYVLDKGVVALAGTAVELATSSELVDTYMAAAPEEVHA